MKKQKSSKEVALKWQLLNLPGKGLKRKVKYFVSICYTLYIILPYLHFLLYIEMGFFLIKLSQVTLIHRITESQNGRG